MIGSTFNSFFQGSKGSQATTSKASNPFSALFMPVDALVARFIVASQFFIKMILRVSDYANIVALVIQSVAINMVNKQMVGWFKKKAMKHNVSPFSVDVKFPLYVKGVSALSRIPFISGDFFKIFVVDKGNFALGKFNYFHGVDFTSKNDIGQQHADKHESRH